MTKHNRRNENEAKAYRDAVLHFSHAYGEKPAECGHCRAEKEDAEIRRERNDEMAAGQV